MQQYELALPNRTEEFFKNLEENKVLRRKKDNDPARPRYPTKEGIFPFLILLQTYLCVSGGLVTPKGNNIQWFYPKRENKRRNQAFCGMAQEAGRGHCSSMAMPSPAQPDAAAPHGAGKTVLPGTQPAPAPLETPQSMSSGHSGGPLLLTQPLVL